MARRIATLVLRTIVILLATFLFAHASQAQATGSLEDQLKNQYKITKWGMDSNGVAVTQPGTVLVIQKGGILGVPPLNATIGNSTYKDGELHSPSNGERMFLGQTTRFFDTNEKVYVIKISANAKTDKVSFTIMECDACNGVNQQSEYKAVVTFQYPKGYLASADAGQVEDVIGQVFSVDSGNGGDNGGQQAQGGQQQQQPPPQQQAPAQTPTIELGQTVDQVEAALGQPDKKVNLGAKVIYVYKDIKVTFVNGKSPTPSSSAASHC
jgi:hypothetical protein